MRIVIVGGGCSGLLVAVHLLRNGFRDPIAIFEPRAALGHGLAYSTAFDEHLLNVCAGKMSGLSSEPTHFADWLRARKWPGASPEAFVPRRIYGEYLSGLLTEQLSIGGHNFRHVHSEVAAIHTAGETARLTLANGLTLAADKVVLALGNPPFGPHLGTPTPGMEHRWDPSPWLGGALQLRAPGERILLLGAGQTAVDAALALQSQPGGCRVYMLSRSGHLPQAHVTHSNGSPPPVAQGSSLRCIFRELRDRTRAGQEAGIGWQSTIDALRPVSNEIWQELSLSDRRRFLRHLKTYWETHRSRTAPLVHERLDCHRAHGRVEVIAGRLRSSRCRAGAIEACIALRHGAERYLQIDRVINCTGIHENYHARPRPLIAALLREGLAHANDLGIGFRTDDDGALTGLASHLLFTLGPPRRGQLFETIAVPEIRAQAEALAKRLMECNSAAAL